MVARRIPAVQTEKRKPSVFEFVPLIIETCAKLKQRMLDRGLRRAWTHCPRPGCGGRLDAALNGPKNHMHAACRTKGCPIRWME